MRKIGWAGLRLSQPREEHFAVGGAGAAGLSIADPRRRDPLDFVTSTSPMAVRMSVPARRRGRSQRRKARSISPVLIASSSAWRRSIAGDYRRGGGGLVRFAAPWGCDRVIDGGSQGCESARVPAAAPGGGGVLGMEGWRVPVRSKQVRATLPFDGLVLGPVWRI